MRKLDLVDYSFLQLETESTPMHVGSLQIFKLPDGAGPTYADELIDVYKDILASTEPFNMKLSKPFLNIGLPDWVPAQPFKPDEHIEKIEIEPPGTDAQLDQLISELNRPLLDRNKPLWKIFLIRGLPDNKVALMFKVSHACIDGMGGMRLMQAFLQKKSKVKQPAGQTLDSSIAGEQADTGQTLGGELNISAVAAKVQAVPRRPVPKGAGMGTPLNNMDRLFEGLKNEWGLWQNVIESYQKTLAGPKEVNEDLLPQPFTAPATPLNGRLTADRSFAFRSISLHEMKALRKAAGVSANDLVMAICSGALRNYLLRMDSLPLRPLIAMVPVSVRSKSAGASGNEVTSMLVNLATHINDPLQRVKVISASANKGKELLGQMSRTAIKRHASLFSSFGIAAYALNLEKLAPPFNVLISNVPASRELLYLHGAELQHLHPISFLFQGQGLNITIISYEYTMDFGFIACDQLVPDVGSLADMHVAAFEELKQTIHGHK